MNEFVCLDQAKGLNIFTQTGAKTGLSAFAVEKDWWVTQMLGIVFDLPYAESLVFKGGTSLSKGYNLIQQFSEDIDLAIDRAYFGRAGERSRSQINKLRRASTKFISTKFIDDIITGIEQRQLTIISIGVEPFEGSDADPLRIYVTYEPLTQKSDYLPPRILLEISCRSLRLNFPPILNFTFKNSLHFGRFSDVIFSYIQVFKWYRLLKKKCESRVSVQEECSQYSRLP